MCRSQQKYNNFFIKIENLNQTNPTVSADVTVFNDDPDQFNSASITVNVIDENDNAPFFLTDLYEEEILLPEDAAVGQTIVTVKVDDEDSFDDGFQFEIISGNRNGAFEIGAAYKDDAGIISSDVKVKTGLDYEGIELRYELIIR